MGFNTSLKRTAYNIFNIYLHYPMKRFPRALVVYSAVLAQVDQPWWLKNLKKYKYKQRFVGVKSHTQS